MCCHRLENPYATSYPNTALEFDHYLLTQHLLRLRSEFMLYIGFTWFDKSHHLDPHLTKQLHSYHKPCCCNIIWSNSIAISLRHDKRSLHKSSLTVNKHYVARGDVTRLVIICYYICKQFSFIFPRRLRWRRLRLIQLLLLGRLLPPAFLTSLTLVCTSHDPLCDPRGRPIPYSLL